ncbi:class I SAM-dependent methyltransferase [Streptomyces sp. NPDC050264]|uniref:class I SAM-dependent methyltransferase n=1 Tax=Streptomyces sp. NPDC050264 TaxID=3155038 RepID=UPI0034254352
MTQTAFDAAERHAWAGRTDAYADSFGKLCGYPVPELLDAAGVREGVRVLDVGTGTGAAAVSAYARGAKVAAVDAEPDMVARAVQAVPGADVRYARLPHLPFGDGEFDAVVGNFVLNHVGRPRAALRELRRVTRPGGLIAVTIWPGSPTAGQALLGRAVQAAGASRPAHLPALAPEEDFARDEEGLTALLGEAGLTDADCTTLGWEHRTTPEEWWSGPAAGVATIGRIVTGQSPDVIAQIKRHFESLAAEYATPSGELVLPHTALLASGRA